MTGKSGVLQFTGSKRIIHDLVTEQQLYSSDFILFKNCSSGGVNQGKKLGKFLSSPPPPVDTRNI